MTMGKPRLDKYKLVSALPLPENALEDATDLSIGQMSLPRSLLQLAEIDQEQEYKLCRAVAERLLEKVPEPEEIDLD